MDNNGDVAIVGMAARFPGARNVEEFWRNLVRGVESIARLSDEEMIAAGVPPAFVARSDYVKAAPVLEDPEFFDAAFFGYSPGEAATLDPQQRLLLELAHTALEDAACDPERTRGPIGVFAGSAMNTYFLHRGLEDRLAENYLPTLVASDKDFLATRISYKLGLRGPSLTVQSACSTSLVAVHLARQSLLNEETDLALAGAVSLRVPHRAGYFYDGSGVVSPDGHVRAFDAAAGGTVFGSGAGVVVLKRLAEARADGDRIHAVIKGSAVNNDGATKAGYTAPSVQGQAEVAVEALANADFTADAISFVEAHGSGTPLGDRIELLALTKAFRRFTARNGYCALGSVKTNVGHLDAAAGMAGLIKTVLALRHRRIPPTLHYSRPNEEIDFPSTPFFVNAESREWRPEGGVRRAAVMSTGMGGTNACVVVEEAPETETADAPPGPHLLLLSARTPSALEAASSRLAEFLAAADGGPALLAETARTLQTGRRFFPHRRFVVCHRSAEAVTALRAPNPEPAISEPAGGGDRSPTVFLLPGIGDHYVGMAQGLYERFAGFRTEIDRCAEILQPLLGLDLREIMYSQGKRERSTGPARGIDLRRMLARPPEEAADPAVKKLDQTLYAHPALFSLEYALAQLWIQWGVRPARLVGHSLGEYVAACLAGVFTLPDALKLVVRRAQLVSELPTASMVAALLSESETLPLLGDGLSLSLINGPRLCVVAGPAAAMARFQKELTLRQVIFRPVRNAHPFHSQLLDPIAASFAQEVARISLSAPRLPFISNVTGTWITAEQAVDPDYWVGHLRRTARFSDALDTLWRLPPGPLVEVGPGRTLGVLAMQHPSRRAAGKPLLVSSLPHDYESQPDADFILHNVGRLWLGGVGIAWDRLEPTAGPRRLSLPTYPFEPQRHWIEPRHDRLPAEKAANGPERKADLADWFYLPSWTRTPFAPGGGGETAAGPLWLVLADSSRAAGRVKTLLEERRCAVEFATFADTPGRNRPHDCKIRPACLDDYLTLLGSLKGRMGDGLNIVHLGALSFSQEKGFHSLRCLAQAIGEQCPDQPIRLGVLTCGVHDVTGGERLDPAMATALGPCEVIPKEYPRVSTFCLDLPMDESGEPNLEEWADHFLDEFDGQADGEVLAYRGSHRWERTFRPQRLAAEATRPPGFKPRGVYLITGGTGGIGLAVAKHLAQTCQARLVLTKKSPFPPKAEWKGRLAAGTLGDSDRPIVEALLEIEALGGEVDVFACDVTDRAAMHRLIAETLARHRAIDGAFHAAGILHDGVIQVQTRETAEAILAPKVDGARVLADVLQGPKPDFLVLFSSLSSVVPLHGQSAYCAANAFLDSFAAARNALDRGRTLSINWPAWREVGLLTERKALAGLEHLEETLRRRAILTREGLEILCRALGAGVAQVAASPQDLAALRADSAAPRLAIAGGQAPAAAASTPERPLASDETGAAVEEEVAGVWKAVLGLPAIDVHANFLDLGGHSLLAMRIVTQLRSLYQADYTLRTFFEHPTIAGTALALQAEIVTEVENLSEEEAVRSAS